MESIDIAIYVGLVIDSVLFILVCVKMYKILHCKRRKVGEHEKTKKEVEEAKITPIEAKIEEVEPVKRKFTFKKIDIKRKSREARQYDIWSK